MVGLSFSLKTRVTDGAGVGFRYDELGRNSSLRRTGRSRLRGSVLERLASRQHALVQNARNEDAVPLRPVEQHMLPLFKASQSGTNPLAWPPQRRIACKRLCATLEAAEVTLRLSRPQV